MSRKKTENKNFLVQDGYLLVFVFVCIFGLISYFFINSKLPSQEEIREVLGTGSIKGVWVSSNTNSCPEANLVNANGCITKDFFKEYESLDKQELFFDDQGKIVFSDDKIFVSGIFTVERVVDNELWPNLRVGDLNIKINDNQWVLEDVVWDRDDPQAVVSLVWIDSSYLVLFHPSVSLTGLSKQFWAFEYEDEESSIRSLSFLQKEGTLGFVDSSYVDVLKKDDTIFLKFERVDPALMGSREVVLYEYGENLEFVDRYILKAE
jgi:hypothetical protein